MTAARKVLPAKELSPDVVDLLRSYNDLMILAEPLLMELWQSVGLTFSQVRVLRWLRSSGPMSASDLAQMTLTPGPSLTRLLTKLEEEGLVVRAMDLKDRRRIMISITTQGRKTLGERHQILRGTVFSEAAQLLPPGTRAQLTKNLHDFRAAIDQIGDESA